MLNNVACNPYQLSTGVLSVPDDVTCGASYSVLGIENGFVCYSGTKVGSTAMYYCFDCGYNSMKKSMEPLIRMCGQHGQWNGTILLCECNTGKCIK